MKRFLRVVMSGALQSPQAELLQEESSGQEASHSSLETRHGGGVMVTPTVSIDFSPAPPPRCAVLSL
ncbi:hypothetical protein EYF80_057778 [Liparis tanakae]|uniref:Uncharacterized protein n=1 Tax=Liparis tanakae TaxID=230148 RepID=A0A4Z2EUL5_9TELE|nr:hypothetical protein EYF80_057778 [Liparis tanakae]